MSQFKLEHSDRLGGLDLTRRKIIDAIIGQQDIFWAVNDAQLTSIRALHGETASKIADEHETTRREIIREVRVSLLSNAFIIMLNFF